MCKENVGDFFYIFLVYVIVGNIYSVGCIYLRYFLCLFKYIDLVLMKIV